MIFTIRLTNSILGHVFLLDFAYVLEYKPLEIQCHVIGRLFEMSRTVDINK